MRHGSFPFSSGSGGASEWTDHPSTGNLTVITDMNVEKEQGIYRSEVAVGVQFHRIHKEVGAGYGTLLVQGSLKTSMLGLSHNRIEPMTAKGYTASESFLCLPHGCSTC